MDECIHGLIGRCHDCAEPPVGIKKTVFITEGGNAFHNSINCELLNAGQMFARSKGMEAHPIVSVPWSVISVERQSCQKCCN